MSTTIKSFFEQQICNLNDKSNKDNERKKAREQVKLSLSKNDKDIFEEGTQSPYCASIPYNCLQYLDKKVNKIFQLSS